MTIQVDCFDSTPLSFKDVVAYEFFMDNISFFFREKEQSGEEFAQSVATLARSAYLIAEVFADARKLQLESNNEETNVES
jgi:hypothetical protein